MVCSQYVLQLPWANELDLPTNTVSGTGPIHPLRLFLLRHNFIILIQKIQSNSYYDAYVVAHDFAYSISDKSTINHVNTDVKNNDYLQSSEAPRKNNCSSASLADTNNKLTHQFCSKIISVIIKKILLKYQIYQIFLQLEVVCLFSNISEKYPSNTIC